MKIRFIVNLGDQIPFTTDVRNGAQNLMPKVTMLNSKPVNGVFTAIIGYEGKTFVCVSFVLRYL